MDVLRALLYGVSAQRPSHSLWIAGEQLPLEARMGGLFLGFLVAFSLLALLGRLRASELPAAGPTAACWGLIALAGIDGANAFFFDGGLPRLYEPTLVVRLLTGLGAGYAVGLVSLPVVAGVVWQAPSAEPAVLDFVELGAGLAGAGALGALLLAGPPPLLWPAALVMVASVLLAFGVASLYLLSAVRPFRVARSARAAGAPTRARRWLMGWVAAGRGAEGAANWAELRGPLVAALGLSLVELAALAGIRAVLSAAGVSF